MTYPPEIKPVPAGTYEPHCLERWSESVAGMDDQCDYADPTRQAAPVELASAAEAA
jgi:hypothetical protein